MSLDGENGREDMSYKARANFDARLEPRNRVLHGAGQDPLGFKEYCQALGTSRLPVLYMTYVGLGGDNQGVRSWGKLLQEQLRACEMSKVLPQIGLSMTGGNDTGEGRDAEVARGAKDDCIDAFCQAVKALNRPSFVRIGYEFEGAWNGYKPETYKTAFVRITQALRRHKIEAATVWCSAGASAGRIAISKVMEYYPGDEWVDWWGIDLFSKAEILSEKTMTFCDHAGTHRKPVMIGEATPRHVGVLEGKPCWDTWFAPFFQLIVTRPEIKAFCYINWEWKHWSDALGFDWRDWGDCRIERNPYVLQRYRKEMDLPLYEHGGGDRV
jgi:hypothetical protein